MSVTAVLKNYPTWARLLEIKTALEGLRENASPRRREEIDRDLMRVADLVAQLS